MVKNLPANPRDVGLILGFEKIPWRKKWQPTPVFLLGKSHGQRSLADYDPWGHKQLDVTEVTSHTRTHCAYKVPCTQGIKTALSGR